VPKQVVQDTIWSERIRGWDKYYKEWEKLFKADILEKYYEGQQWKSQKELAINPYVINKVYETIQIKIAEFVPTFPKYQVSAKPANYDWDLEAALNSAQLKEDVLNSIISNAKGHFIEEIEQIYKDSFFRFGIAEVGYSADWILNPNAPKPLLKGDTDKHLSQKERSRVRQEPEELPVNERIYIRHISAKRFRVGGFDHKYLSRCGYVGYYDYVYKQDLMSLKGLMNRDKIDCAQEITPNQDTETLDMNVHKPKGGLLKIWHVWDMRSMFQLLILDNPCNTIYQKKFKRLPLIDFRPDRRLITEGFYPIPPVYHWLSPQDEINETREMLRAHRRRFVRKFMVTEGAIDDEEIEKFETGPDGALVKVKKENAIVPIQNADLGQALTEAIQTSGDDLIRISGTTNPDRGISDRGTATEANITEARGQIRQTKDRDRWVWFLSLVGREVLLTARDKFTLGIWAELTAPEGETFLGSVKENQAEYKYVTSEDLNDGYDFKIDVDVTSMSSAAQQDEKQHYLEFLGAMNQFPQISFSPLLVRETAYRMGYRNTKVIKELQKMALMQELGRQLQMQMQLNQMKQMAGQPPPNPGNAGQQIVAQQTPPAMEQIRNQIANQPPVQ
jgi:hypothetical protein